MTRAMLVSCVMLALAGAMCGGSAGSAAPPASGGQAAQPPAAAPANPGAGQPGSPMMSSDAPDSKRLFEERGLDVVAVDISEFIKLEGCVTCLSVRLRHTP